MTETVQTALKRLVLYALDRHLIEEEDTAFAINGLLDKLGLSAYEDPCITGELPLEDILKTLNDYAAEAGLLENDSVVYRDLFDTSLMGVLTPRPSEVQRRFFDLYKESPQAATDYFCRLSYDADYIRAYRVVRDLKWQTPSAYGDMDITINLSKPEKDPLAIAKAKLLPQSGYPKCLLCHDNEGFVGNAGKPARQNLRQIPMTLGGELWYMQYSPYVYYNEHCIVLSAKHEPMSIKEETFVRMLDFVAAYPHYFIGSNADLPIVGGSILSHDHMQGGRYTFAMAKAPIAQKLSFADFPTVASGIVRWPMSVIRLSSSDRTALTALAVRILDAWRGYTDEEAFIFAETNGEKHNTITPIARMRDGLFELDLVLRNNITTEEHPLGVYHPHKELHHIKKENIGLIEVMGLAVLPARLADELTLVGEALLNDTDMEADDRIAHHAEWAKEIKKNHLALTEDNVQDVLRTEVGAVFVKVLEDAGVYRADNDGLSRFLRFTAACGAERV